MTETTVDEVVEETETPESEEPTVSFQDLIEERLSEHPIAKVVGDQLSILCDKLAEIAKAVNAGDGGPKKPTIGEVIKEATDSEDASIKDLLAAYNVAKEASKKAYREVLVSLHPEYATDDSDDEVDDSERTAQITEAKDVFAKVKSGLAFIESLDGFAGFSDEFLKSVPVVEGARMRTSGSDTVGIRPRFSSIEVLNTESGSVLKKVKTATDVAAFFKTAYAADKSVEVLKGYTSGDLIKGWIAAGGKAETVEGTVINVEVGPYTVVTTKA